MPVLDPQALSQEARKSIVSAWGTLKDQELAAVSELAQDLIRAQIDEALCAALGLDSDPVDNLRNLLGAEPRFRPPPKKKKSKLPSPQRQLF